MENAWLSRPFPPYIRRWYSASSDQVAAFGRVESGTHTRAPCVEAQTAVVQHFLEFVLDCTIQAATFRVRSISRLE